MELKYKPILGGEQCMASSTHLQRGRYRLIPQHAWLQSGLAIDARPQCEGPALPYPSSLAALKVGEVMEDSESQLDACPSSDTSSGGAVSAVMLHGPAMLHCSNLRSSSSICSMTTKMADKLNNQANRTEQEIAFTYSEGSGSGSGRQATGPPS